MRHSFEKSGFTLIELLVVIAMIGTLSTIVLASLGTARDRAENTKINSTVKAYRDAINMHYAQHGSYPTDGSLDLNYTYCLGHYNEDDTCTFDGDTVTENQNLHNAINVPDNPPISLDTYTFNSGTRTFKGAFYYCGDNYLGVCTEASMQWFENKDTCTFGEKTDGIFSLVPDGEHSFCVLSFN